MVQNTTPARPDLVRPIAFVFCNVGSYRMQRIMMRACIEQGRPFALMCVDGAEIVKAEARADAGEWGVPFECLGEDDLPPVSQGLSDRAKSALWTALSLGELRGFSARVKSQRARVALAVASLNRLKPCCVVLSEDGVSGPLHVVAAARRLNLPIVDVPYGNAGRSDFDIELDRRLDEDTLIRAEGARGRMIKMFCRQWIKTGRHAGALLFQPDHVLAVEAAGMSLRDAWVVHGGHSDILCAENAVGRRQYESEGAPAGKLRDTGSPYCDAVGSGARQDAVAEDALRMPRRIDPAKTRILVSWPPSYHQTYPGRNEFETYEEMTSEALSFLAGLPNTQVTLSLHPACADETATLARAAGLEPTTEDLLTLIARHDVFVTYFSSAIRWALAAGKPVVNYNAYGVGLDVYDSAPGFINAATFDEFKTRLGALIASDQAFAEVAAAQIAVADDWGILDGKCTERIFAEIDRLVAARSPAAKSQEA